jgi:hypothetical protein
VLTAPLQDVQARDFRGVSAFVVFPLSFRRGGGKRANQGSARQVMQAEGGRGRFS